MKFVFRLLNIRFNCIFIDCFKDHRNRLLELITKAKDLKTKLYDECLSKDLAKIFINKIEQMIVKFSQQIFF